MRSFPLTVLLAAGLACMACSSSKLGSPAGSGGRGGSVLTGMGGGDVVGTGGDGGGGRGGDSIAGGGGEAGGGRGGEAGGGRGGEPGGRSGGIAGFSGRGGSAPTGGGGDASVWFSCMPESPKAVIGCGEVLSASSVGLAPDGKAYVSIAHRLGAPVMAWDNTGGWKGITGASSPRPLRVDSQGRPMLAYMGQTNTGVVPFVDRWDGTRWESLTGQVPTTGAAGPTVYDFEVDALDRPVLLLLSTGNILTVQRLESGTWVQLGGATQINSAPATSYIYTSPPRLALDSADGVTPNVAYRPDVATSETIVLSRLTSTGWSESPALTRALNAGFDLAVAGGQPVLAYIDGATEDGRLFISQVGATGWSAGVPLNDDTDRPVIRTRILTTGPAPENLIVGYGELDPHVQKYKVSFKRGPDWSFVPGAVPPVAGDDIRLFEMAVDASRIAFVWLTYVPEGWALLGYHEFPR